VVGLLFLDLPKIAIACGLKFCDPCLIQRPRSGYRRSLFFIAGSTQRQYRAVEVVTCSSDSSEGSRDAMVLFHMTKPKAGAPQGSLPRLSRSAD
jgi:hypothetical protein